MHYVIIGAGPAGVTAAETLREKAPSAAITLIGSEPEPPYSRMAIPYYLIDKIGEEGTYLRKQKDYYSDRTISVLQATVTGVDSAAKRLSFADGQQLAYDKLLIATGATPIRAPIPGVDLPRVQTCWTLEDARTIIDAARPGARVLLMGAGFIGCIILEALARRGVELTVVEMGDRMVPRMMNDKAGLLLKSWCEAQGVRVLTATRVEAIEETGPPAAAAEERAGMLARAGNALRTLFGAGKAAPATTTTRTEQPAPLQVLLNTGERLQADLVISATGVRPNVSFLAGSGIEVDQGIVVDEYLRSSVADIYAAGDVAQARDFSTGEFHVQAIQPTAVEHARLAAKNMVSGHEARHWGSVNMNVLETLGLVSCSFGLWMGVDGGEQVERYTPEQYRYLSLQFKDDVLVGASCVGMTEHIGVLRGLIQSRARLGQYKAMLEADPTRLMPAYLASVQGATVRSPAR